MGQVHGDAEVDVEQSVDLGRGHLFEVAEPPGAGIGDDDVDPVKSRRRRLYHLGGQPGSAGRQATVAGKARRRSPMPGPVRPRPSPVPTTRAPARPTTC